MTEAHPAPENLPRNQALVLRTLAAAGAPLSAYAILDRLRDDGLRAPLQVYRALDKLIAAGHVHKLESLNAFVACRHPAHAGHEAMTFVICDQCGLVTEIDDDRIAADLAAIASRQDFAPKSAVIELRGRCRDCR